MAQARLRWPAPASAPASGMTTSLGTGTPQLSTAISNSTPSRPWAPTKEIRAPVIVSSLARPSRPAEPPPGRTARPPVPRRSDLVLGLETHLDQVAKGRDRQTIGGDPGRHLGLDLQRPQLVVADLDVLQPGVASKLPRGGLDEEGHPASVRQLDADGTDEMAHLLAAAGVDRPPAVVEIVAHGHRSQFTSRWRHRPVRPVPGFRRRPDRHSRREAGSHGRRAVSRPRERQTGRLASAEGPICAVRRGEDAPPQPTRLAPVPS